MPTPSANAPAWTLLIPLVAVALVILRNARARRLRIESLWISPVIILALVGLSLSQQGMPSLMMIGVDAIALAAGAGLGWWRARFTTIAVDPATHELTSRASPVGMIVLLAIFAVRYGIRFYAAENAGALGAWTNVIADGALVLSVGLVCAQRLEIALRATRLLNAARAGALPAG